MKRLVDDANWDGIILKRTNVGGTSKGDRALLVNGVQYVTEGEAILARLLADLGIPFTPNVKFVLKASPGSKGGQDVIYVPDFIFDRRAYLWRNEDGSVEMIHGIECKGLHPRRCRTKGAEKVRLLKTQRGINVKMLSTDEIRSFARSGRLPMTPI